MKEKLFILLLLSAFSLNAIAQLNVSTNLRQDCVWDTEKEDWNVVSSNEEALTFFEFNKDFTMFKHTTQTITSAYIIKKFFHDEEKDHYELDIVSDVGNKYMMVIDLNNENLRFLYNIDESLVMVHHTIKSYWYDEEE